MNRLVLALGFSACALPSAWAGRRNKADITSCPDISQLAFKCSPTAIEFGILVGDEYSAEPDINYLETTHSAGPCVTIMHMKSLSVPANGIEFDVSCTSGYSGDGNAFFKCQGEHNPGTNGHQSIEGNWKPGKKAVRVRTLFGNTDPATLIATRGSWTTMCEASGL